MRTIRFLLGLLILAMPAALFGQIGVRIAIGPPMLPFYDQPICPVDGYLWTPGYWAYDDSISDYYWVPGTWVLAPEVGYLWTPGYWGWGNGGYFFNEGYWGPEVGFYGGINYGFGYFGEGYEGGRWDNGHFFYNRSVNNLDTTKNHNVYNATVENSTNGNRVSYNGGAGGHQARPNSEEEAAAQQRHIPAVACSNRTCADRARQSCAAGSDEPRPTANRSDLKARRFQRTRSGRRQRGSGAFRGRWHGNPAPRASASERSSADCPARAGQFRECEGGQELPKAARQVDRQANSGAPGASAEAGIGTSAACSAKCQRRTYAASGAKAPATDAESGAKTQRTAAVVAGSPASASRIGAEERKVAGKPSQRIPIIH